MCKYLRPLFFSLMTVIAVSQTAYAASYDIDLDHSTVGFKIRHLLSNVRGTFDQFSGSFEYEPGKPELWKVEASIQSETINTNVNERDKHLKGADFFDVEKYPVITFKSTQVTLIDDQHAKIEGLLSLHGVEKSVILDVEIHGVATDPWGNVRSAFTATTRINRKDFGLVYNQTLETGNVLIGEEVDLTIEIEGLQKE